MLTLIALSVAGAVISAVVGTIWYSMATPMGRLHMKYLGFDVLTEEQKKQKIEEAKPKMPKIYGAQMALSLLTSFATVFIITMSVQNGLSLGMAFGFIIFNWLCFTVPTVGTGILWGTCDPKIAWQKFFSDSFSNLVTILIIAGLASLFA